MSYRTYKKQQLPGRRNDFIGLIGPIRPISAICYSLIHARFAANPHPAG